MSKKFALFVMLMAVVGFAAPAVLAQGNVKSGPEASTIRDAELEQDSQHNLEVARNYFNLKKAYVAALRRCEEVVASNPGFARFDEVLYLAGASSKYLAENKGKQNPSQYVTLEDGVKKTPTAEEFREMARGYLGRLVSKYPESKFFKQAQADLESLGEAPAKP
jgi:outer membrane protein assembly factor BamD (BamD/ComL family)